MPQCAANSGVPAPGPSALGPQIRKFSGLFSTLFAAGYGPMDLFGAIGAGMCWVQRFLRYFFGQWVFDDYVTAEKTIPENGLFGRCPNVLQIAVSPRLTAVLWAHKFTNFQGRLVRYLQRILPPAFAWGHRRFNVLNATLFAILFRPMGFWCFCRGWMCYKQVSQDNKNTRWHGAVAWPFCLQVSRATFRCERGSFRGFNSVGFVF